MPVSTRSKAKAGERGAENARDSASEKRAKMNGGFTAAERCAERLAGQSRDLTVGEQVIKVPLTRDLTIPLNRALNPYKLADLQYVLNFRTFYGLLPDVDLKEWYFEGAWGFRKDEFVLANWRAMSVEEMKGKVRWAHPEIGYRRRVYPPGKVDVHTLNTKEEIVRAFWELTYVPAEVYMTAVAGAHVLRSVKAGKVGEDRVVVGEYLRWACQAGLDLPVIRGLAEKCLEGDIHTAARRAAKGGHADVLDLWASEFGARIFVDCLAYAARWGHDAMIDHLVEKYRVDPNEADVAEWTALHYAAMSGRVRTVKHLVEKHKVDIHKRDWGGKTALDLAEEKGRTECVAYLRALMSTRPPSS